MKRLLLLLALIPLSAGAVSVRYTLTVNSASSTCGAVATTQYQGGTCPEGPPNDAPVWNSTPAPSFSVSVAGSYPIANSADTADTGFPVSDAQGDALTITNETGCTLPTGVTVDDTNDELDYDGMGNAGTTTGCVLGANDGTAATQNSSAFPITITAASSFAAHSHTYDSILGGTGAEGGIACYGCNWDSFIDSSPAVEFRYITNLNTSGAGSFKVATENCSANTLTIVVPEVSGIIEYAKNSRHTSSCSNLIVLFSAAPSPGLYVQNLMLKPNSANRQAYYDYAGWDGLSDASDTGKCVQVGIQSATLGDTTDIVFISYGCGFMRDGAMDLYGGVQRFSLLHSLLPYPIGQNGTTVGHHLHLLGHQTGKDDKLLYARNFGAHSKGRNPKFDGARNNAYYENVMYNAGNHFTDIAHGDGTGNGFKLNLRNNLCVDGPDGASTLPCIRINSNIEAGTEVYYNGNHVSFFSYNNSPESNLVQNNAGGSVTFPGSVISTAHPTGWNMTSITDSGTGRQNFAALICDNAGPRAGDRLSWWDHPCNEVENRYDGTGSVGEHILATASHPDGGVPVVAENTCDSSIANNCGTGKPAVPSSPTAREAVEWAWTVKCAVSPAGFPGC